MITAKGNDVKQNIKKSGLKAKDEYITLKEDEEVKVRLLAVDDYVEYMSHGGYNLDIYTQPCPNPKAGNCAYCLASKSGVEEFDALKLKPRYLFAFANLDNGKIMLLDLSKNQAKKLMSSIDEYEEDIDSIAFKLKRVGNGKDTAYVLNPILKMKSPEKEAFEKFNGEVVDLQFFVDRLEVKVSTEEFKIRRLSEAGYPNDKLRLLVGDDIVDRALAEAPADEVTPIDDGNVPF